MSQCMLYPYPMAVGGSDTSRIRVAYLGSLPTTKMMVAIARARCRVRYYSVCN